MGYIAFTMIVAASGALIVWFWHRSYTADRYARFGRASHLRNGLRDDPIPPVKRALDGLSEAEKKRLEFEGNIDVWQRKFESRKAAFNNNVDTLEGERYTFVPGPRRDNSAASSA